MSFKHEKRRNDTELGCNKDVFNSGLFVKLGTTVPLGTTGPFHSGRFFTHGKTPITSQIRDQKLSGKFLISSEMSLVVMRKRAIDDFSTFKPVPRIQKRSKCFHSFISFQGGKSVTLIF